jgi:hypothetical protein
MSKLVLARDPATGAPGMACAHPGEGGSNDSARVGESGVSALANIVADTPVIETNLIAFSRGSLA